jgi:hypothetical protein
MYIDVFDRTQITLLTVFVIWHVVSTYSMGQHQNFEQNRACIPTPSAMRQEMSPFTLK